MRNFVSFVLFVNFTGKDWCAFPSSNSILADSANWKRDHVSKNSWWFKCLSDSSDEYSVYWVPEFFLFLLQFIITPKESVPITTIASK